MDHLSIPVSPPVEDWLAIDSYLKRQQRHELRPPLDMRPDTSMNNAGCTVEVVNYFYTVWSIVVHC
jgi:hypothetical protein